MPWRCSRAASRRAAASVASGRLVAAGGRQQRVDARRVARPAPCAGRARPGAPRRSSPPRGAGGPWSARRTGRPPRARGRSPAAPRAARPRAGRARRAWRAAPPGRSRAGSARPPPWPPRPPPRSATRPRRGGGTRSPRAGAALPGSPSSRTPPITSSPEVIGTSASMPGGTCAGPVLGRGRRRSGAATPRSVPGRRRRHGRAEARDHDRHRSAGGVGGELGDAAQAVAAQHGVHHLEMDGPQPLDERAGGCRGSSGWAAAICSSYATALRLGRRPGAPAASPRRTRRCGSGRPPRPAGRTPCRRRSSPCGRA